MSKLTRLIAGVLLAGCASSEAKDLAQPPVRDEYDRPAILHVGNKELKTYDLDWNGHVDCVTARSMSGGSTYLLLYLPNSLEFCTERFGRSDYMAEPREISPTEQQAFNKLHRATNDSYFELDLTQYQSTKK